MTDWDRRFLDLARLVSTWSKDPSTQVGAVLVSGRREFLGYNGFPQGVLDTPERYADRGLKYKLIVHAEVNAILKAGEHARGGSLYVYPSFALPPICNECAKIAIQAGIWEVVGLSPDLSDPRTKRWLESIEISRAMFKEAGVKWREILS